MREIKFRAWIKDNELMITQNDFRDYSMVSNGDGFGIVSDGNWMNDDSFIIMQFTGLKDKNGKDIYEGDVLEFADKWEWYRGSYGIKMRFAEGSRLTELQEMYDAEPMERRVIEIPSCYEWILSSEIQTYWHVIGNIYDNPELLKP